MAVKKRTKPQTTNTIQQILDNIATLNIKIDALQITANKTEFKQQMLESKIDHALFQLRAALSELDSISRATLQISTKLEGENKRLSEIEKQHEEVMKQVRELAARYEVSS